MNELVRYFNNSELSINLTSILILNNETNEFEPWFIANEIATLLGYIETAKAIRTHVDEEDQKMVSHSECVKLFGDDSFGVPEMDTRDYSSNINSNGMKIINESGLYTLITRSDKQEAKQFRRWVTSEVLPSIRKSGQCYDIFVIVN